jgi:hypothetical protein
MERETEEWTTVKNDKRRNKKVNFTEPTKKNEVKIDVPSKSEVDVPVTSKSEESEASKYKFEEIYMFFQYCRGKKWDSSESIQITDIEKMWQFFNCIPFTEPIKDCKINPHQLFQKFLDTRDKNSREENKKMVDTYNESYFTTVFKKQPGNDDPIDRKTRLNIINFNLKQTKDMAERGVFCFDPSFENGLINHLLLKLIGQSLPEKINDEISAMMFQQIVVLNGKMAYKGWRLRITTYSSDSKIVEFVQKELNKLIIELGFGECIC